MSEKDSPSCAPIIAYVFQTQPIEKALPKLLEKIISQGYNTVIKLESIEEVEYFNISLWTYHPKSFLPHGKDNSKNASKHPILLTDSFEVFKNPPNKANIAISFSLQEIKSCFQEASFEKLIWIAIAPLTENDKLTLKEISKNTNILLHNQKKDLTWEKKHLSF